MGRKVIIAGNWKMNKDAAAGKELVESLKPLVADLTDAEVVVCPPFTTLNAVVAAAAGSNIKVGAQNVHWAESGAFTGEISAEMLVSSGVEYVIIGHSERRQYFGETDATVNARMKAALKAGLKVIVCVGETLEEREGDKTADVFKYKVWTYFNDITELTAFQIQVTSGSCAAVAVVNGNYPGTTPKQFSVDDYNKDAAYASSLGALITYALS